MKKFTRKTHIISALAVLLIGGVVFALTRPNSPQAQIDTPKPVSTEDVQKDTQKSDTSAPSTSPAQSSQPQNLPVINKPVLAKSSGNNGPVQAKTNIEFSCSGTLDASCYVTLTNQDDPSNNLKFDPKTITDDGRGNTSVTWIWEAKAGTWTVKATQSASGYQSNTSDAQTLIVNP